MRPDHNLKPARKTGMSHFFAAASYSAGGLQRLFREAAFRQEMLAALAIGGLFTWVGVGLRDYAIFAVLVLLTVAVEAINTAIEELVDHASPGWSQFAKNAKDLGSLAVMCLLLSDGIFVAWVLFGG